MTPQTAAAGPGHAWHRGVVSWDVYYGIVLLATLALVETVGSLSAGERVVAGAALVAMVPWYAVVGRPVLIGTRERTVRGTVYLAGLAILLVVAESQSLNASYALFAICPQCFMALPFRRAVAAVCVVSTSALVVLLALGHPSRAELIPALAIAVVGVTFSVGFGGWVSRIIDQSRERAELVEQLEATRAELAVTSREAGRLAERQLLAAEIHDTLAQGFTSILMLAQAAEAAIDRDRGAARQHIRQAAEVARENLAEARALVSGLPPARLSADPLPDALRRLAERATAEFGFHASLEVTGEARPLDTASEVVILRTCQEALSNVRKHARAQQAAVRLSYAAAEVALEVHDDGAGFAAGAPTTGYGLAGMRARVTEAGGSMQVSSAPGAGTVLSVVVPG